MPRGKTVRLFGGKNGIECTIPQSFFNYVVGGPFPMPIAESDSISRVVKGSNQINPSPHFRGKYFKYENADTVTVLNHEEFEEEETSIEDVQSKQITKILFVVFPTHKIAVLGSTTGYKAVSDYFNSLLPGYFAANPEAKSTFDTIYCEQLLSYQEPKSFLLKNKSDLKSVTYQIPAINLPSDQKSLEDGVSSRSNLLVTVTYSAAKRGESLDSNVPEDLIDFIDKVDGIGGGSKFKSISAKKKSGSNEMLMSSAATFDFCDASDSEKFDELFEVGSDLIEDLGSMLEDGHHG